MKEEKKQKQLKMIVFWVTYFVIRFFLEYVIAQKKKRSLLYRYLIDEDTEILNIYTKDYVEKDEKANLNFKHENISSATTILKPTFWIKVLHKIYREDKFQKKIISEYVREMDSLNKNATVIIHVASEKEKCKYMELRTELYFIKNVHTKIKIIKFDEEQIFEE